MRGSAQYYSHEPERTPNINKAKRTTTLLTLGCTTLAALVSGAAQRAQVAVLQRAVAVITACATGGNQLEQVLLWHEAPRKCPAT